MARDNSSIIPSAKLTTSKFLYIDKIGKEYEIIMREKNWV